MTESNILKKPLVLFNAVINQTIAQNGFFRYLKNTGWTFLTRIALMASSFIVGIFVTRYLQPAYFGQLNYVISYIGLFSFIAGFGIDAVIGRELILNHEKRATIIGTSFKIYVLSTLIAIVCANSVAYFLENDLYLRILIFIYSLTFLFQSFGVIGAYFQANVLAKTTTKVQLAIIPISMLCKVIGIMLHFSISWFIFIYVIEALLSSVGIIYSYLRLNEKIDWKIDKVIARKLIKDSAPFMFSIIAVSIYMKIDQVILKHMLNDIQTGVYATATRLSEYWYFIPNLLSAALFPAVVNAKKTNLKVYLNRVILLTGGLTLIAIILAIPLFVLAPIIIEKLYGTAFIEAVAPFRYYVWSSIPVFAMTALSTYFITENRGGMLLIFTTSGAVLNVILNFMLIPLYGITGSAIATLIAYIIPALLAGTYFIIQFIKVSPQNHAK